MSDNNNTIKTTVVLDTTQAQQQIVKLGAVASDSTKDLEERTAAKNKQVKLQNELAAQTIKNLEEEKKALQGLEGTEKQVQKIQVKLNRAKISATKASENGAKQQRKLNEALKDSKSATKGLDEATGGLLGKMKAFVTNPIGAVVILIAGAFKLLQKAIGRSGKASETFSKIGAKLSGIFNGLLAVLGPVVEFIGKTLLKALESPKQSLIDLGNIIKENLINRVKAFLVLGDAIVELFKGNFKKAGKLAADGFLQLSTGVEHATDKIVAFAKTAKVAYKEAADATDLLVNSERRLAENKIALEKQQLTSLRLAEKERQVRDDVSKSIAQRIAANKHLGEILDTQSKKELGLAQQNLDIALAKQKATGDTIENLENVGEAEVKLLEIQERITGQRSEQIVNEQSLIKEGIDQKKVETAKALDLEKTKQDIRDRDIEAQIEYDDLKLEQNKAAGEDTLAAELEILKRRKEQDLANADLTANEKLLIEEQYAQASEDITKASEDSKIKSKQIASDAAIGLAAEQFGVSKEVAIAEMIMAAPAAIGNSFKTAAKIYPFPLSIAMGAAGAAGTVIPIIKGLSDIKKARFPGKKKGGGAPASGGGGGSISSSSGAAASAIPPEAVSDIAANNAARLGVDPNIGASAGASAANNILGGAANQVVFSEAKYNDFQRQVKFKEEKTQI